MTTTYTILASKTGDSDVILHFVANAAVVVAGNNSVSNICANSTESIVNGHIRSVIWGTGNGSIGYWKIARGDGNVVAILPAGGSVDYAGMGINLSVGNTASNLVANLFNTTDGYLIVKLRKSVTNPPDY